MLQLAPTRRLSVEDAPRRLNITTSRRGRLGGPDEPLLSIPQLPAGDYDVFLDAHDALTGEVTVTLGHQEVPMSGGDSMADRRASLDWCSISPWTHIR